MHTLLFQDLAARNIMVSQDEICKVGDFGLLRELPKDSEIYVATSKKFLPWQLSGWHLRVCLLQEDSQPPLMCGVLVYSCGR